LQENRQRKHAADGGTAQHAAGRDDNRNCSFPISQQFSLWVEDEWDELKSIRKWLSRQIF
jgi:hypothetical protein